MPLAPYADPWKQDGENSTDILADDDETNTEASAVVAGDREPTTEIDISHLTIAPSGTVKVEPLHFQLVRVLGEGSFGKVFLVRKACGDDEGTFYAMKVLKKATLKVRDRLRSKKERDILADVRHPFIVSLYYAFQTEGKLYLILDFLRGGDLFTYLAKEVMFTEDDVKFYLAEMALALNHLHSLGIIYRDLKPENILLGADGHICLTDFGLSKEAARDTKTFSFCGTVDYMAPEIINRHGHTSAADWWSFGVLMYEMLTGSLPFRGANRHEIMSQVLHARLSMPPFLSSGAQSLLRLLFKRNPCRRLCSSDAGFTELQQHAFFCCIDWTRLLHKQIDAPFKPAVTRHDDTFYFDPVYTSRTPKDSPCVPVSADSQQLFRGFSFVASAVLEDHCPRPAGNAASGHSNSDIHTAHLKLIQPNKITDAYQITEVIGTGTFSVCRLCVHKSTRAQYAVKIIDKKKRSECYEEIEILLRHGSHPNIVHLRDVYEDADSFYLVMEYLRGGELLQRMQRCRRMSERHAADIIHVIMTTVSYLHQNGVVHRDLKPSNLMYASPAHDHISGESVDATSADADSLRLCDFGFATQMRSCSGLLMTPCYTAHFGAPEVLRRQGYDTGCDVWSVGVILYTMLAGRTPYASGREDTTADILGRISQGRLDLSSQHWTQISSAAKDLVSRMLHVDRACRISAADVLRHEWIVNRQQLPCVAPRSADHQDSHLIRTAINATYRAVTSRTGVQPTVGPVTQSLLARRRLRKNSLRGRNKSTSTSAPSS